MMRILDSKDPKDQEILRHAPIVLDYLKPAAKAHFEKVLSLLTDLKIPHVVTPKLVRGLDYYNNTVFEITSGQLGAQNSVGGGGRYDGLTAALGGPDLPAVGFATGIERLLQTMLKQEVYFPTASHPLLFVIPMGEESTRLSFHLISTLRHQGISAEIDLSGKKIQHGLQLANELGATYAAVIGEEELNTKQLKLKNMSTRETIEIPLEKLQHYLKEPH
jgi:histidyl-tRNA synthetase